MLWKGAPSTPLSTIATIRIVSGVLERNGLPGAVTALCQGGDDIGKKMSNDPRVKLVSFTGSTNAGKHVAMAVQSRLPNNTGKIVTHFACHISFNLFRFGKTVLELGGNNALVVDKSADLEMMVRSATFACVGTAGQRCTTLRRIILHEDVYDTVLVRISLRISDSKPSL